MHATHSIPRGLRRLGLALVGLILAATASAQTDREVSGDDVLRLKNGREFKGRLVGEDDKQVTFVFRGSEIVLPKRLVKELIRGERKEVEEKAEEATRKLLTSGDRYEERTDLYYVYYRGRRVGWREVKIAKTGDPADPGYAFEARTVFRKKDGSDELDLRVRESVGRDLRPRTVSVLEKSDDYNEIRNAAVESGHLKLTHGAGANVEENEVLFAEETELLMPLLRRLADSSHFPEKGKTFKVFDSVEERFVRVHAIREVRKEWVAGKHQFLTIWRLSAGERAWEIWFDGRGSVVREELGGPHMVAVRAEADKVAAFARGEDDGGDPQLSLDYEDVPLGFRIVRPNLTWSFEIPEPGASTAISLVNPTLQASADVFAMSQVGREVEPETFLLDLLERLGRKSEDAKVLYQKPEAIGGRRGIRFEMQSRRRDVELRTIGAVCTNAGRAYAILLAVPEFRFRDARPQLEQILAAFEVLGRTENVEPPILLHD
ncbi:MAG: hypothetical protein R3F20_14755 [Planctomycetota bacterium]